jgi:CheY-like chemotaxis protein
LEENGFKVDEFNDPILALNNYQVNFYDLVILDIKMPKMDGFEFYIKIREQDPKAKISFLTAITTFTEDCRKTRLALGKTINETLLYSKARRNGRFNQKINIDNEYLKTNIYIDNINVCYC